MRPRRHTTTGARLVEVPEAKDDRRGVDELLYGRPLVVPIDPLFEVPLHPTRLRSSASCREAPVVTTIPGAPPSLRIHAFQPQPFSPFGPPRVRSERV
jgi:hypothetical protein